MIPADRARLMWEELHEVMSNEVAWAIIKRHLEEHAGQSLYEVQRDCDTEGAVAQVDGEEK